PGVPANPTALTSVRLPGPRCSPCSSNTQGLICKPLGQSVGPFRAVAGAEADHYVATPGEPLQHRGDLVLAGDGSNAAMPCVANGLGQCNMIDAIERRLTCRIQRCQNDGVSILEAGSEIIKQVAHARVPVRLHDGDDAPTRSSARGLQHCSNFYRMM